jgi:hypothetical protein
MFDYIVKGIGNSSIHRQIVNLNSFYVCFMGFSLCFYVFYCYPTHPQQIPPFRFIHISLHRMLHWISVSYCPGYVNCCDCHSIWLTFQPMSQCECTDTDVQCNILCSDMWMSLNGGITAHIRIYSLVATGVWVWVIYCVQSVICQWCPMVCEQWLQNLIHDACICKWVGVV